MIDLNIEMNKANTLKLVALRAIQLAVKGKAIEGGEAFAMLSEMGYEPEDASKLIWQMKSI